VADAPCALAKRVSLLDSKPIYADLHGDLDADLDHFIRTIEAITPPGSVSEQLPTASASPADEIIGECRLVHRLIEKAPEIAVGPLVRTEQYWVATGRCTVALACDAVMVSVEQVRSVASVLALLTREPVNGAA
jgi:hypothetical protein